MGTKNKRSMSIQCSVLNVILFTDFLFKEITNPLFQSTFIQCGLSEPKTECIHPSRIYLYQARLQTRFCI